MLSLIATGFAEVCNPLCIALIAGGVLLGIIFGSIPGLSATMAVALCLPMTYGLEPIAGMALLLGLYIGGISGGLVAAILLRICAKARNGCPHFWKATVLRWTGNVT